MAALQHPEPHPEPDLDNADGPLTRGQFAQVVEAIEAFWPQRGETLSTVALDWWWRALQPYSFRQIGQAIVDLSQTATFRPAIAEIVTQIRRHAVGALPDADEVLAELAANLRCHGSYVLFHGHSTPVPVEWSHPAICDWLERNRDWIHDPVTGTVDLTDGTHWAHLRDSWLAERRRLEAPYRPVPDRALGTHDPIAQLASRFPELDEGDTACP